MKYSVYFTQTVSVTVDVEADDPQDAIELAYEEVTDENGETVWSETEEKTA